MSRALILASVLCVIPAVTASQAPGLLRVRVVLVDPDGKIAPVPRHALLVSENPASATPRRIVTALDGTAELKLRPGNYTVESDQPVAFHGTTYQWTQTLDVVAGRDTILELTATNADSEAVGAGTTSAGSPATDPAFLLSQWQDSVLTLWTPATRGSGFVIDAKGLIATNQRIIGGATSIEVQLKPALKVAGRVLVADPDRDVAVIVVAAAVTAPLRAITLPCPASTNLPVDAGEEIFTISVPLRQQKRLASGAVKYVGVRGIESDLAIARGSAGGPVFNTHGALVGLTSIRYDDDGDRHGDTRVVRIDNACDVVASARKTMEGTEPPSATHLPVEPSRPLPSEALEDAAKRHTGSPSPYLMSTASFDVAFITPVLTYAAERHLEQRRRRERESGARASGVEPRDLRALRDFANWSEYVREFPPVLLIRVTPKLVEGLWTKVARYAARTQGVSIPPIKRLTPGFSRLRAFCGEQEVTPIHPFLLEQRISDTDAIHEGLYVFDPDALGPHCETVKLVLHSEKAPEKGDPLVVEPGVVQQFWQDFAPYRDIPR